ncbi:uncharacterized protein LOC119698851 [Motacilla alba alba]|uniref:uncharacterized protein LOC119698851 n=1 Tax=Motacilla alba alba TaxID=1094192 RepID=UPI0018D53FDA|nr:uncharacterized protein LOC119698851 [Motacilla alba alba]
MAGWSPCGEPVPFTRLLLGRVADNTAPGKTQSHGFGETAEAGDRAGGGEPVAAGGDGSSAGEERSSRGETGQREEDGDVRAAAAWAELCFPVPANRRGAAGFVHGLSDFIPSQTVIQIHPTFRATANVRGGIGRKEVGREREREGGSTEAASFVSVPQLPIPGAHCILPPSGLWPCLVLFRALCVGRGEEGAGRPGVQKLRAEREG